MRLAVVGSINIDMTVTAERIPLKGETLMGDNISYIPGGKGANQAVAMAKLGAEVEMFGCVGDDENGKKMIDNMKNHGIKTDNIKVLEGVPTGIAMSKRKSRQRIYRWYKRRIKKLRYGSTST